MLIKTTSGIINIINRFDDGVNHINIFSKADTQLGRDLSNFSNHGFTHPTLGSFKSMEGYWHWIATGMLHSEFREVSGPDAKTIRKFYSRVKTDDFTDLILEGLHCKLAQNPQLLNTLLTENLNLPFSHYYSYSGIFTDKYDSSAFWLKELDRIRLGAPLMF